MAPQAGGTCPASLQSPVALPQEQPPGSALPLKLERSQSCGPAGTLTCQAWQPRQGSESAVLGAGPPGQRGQSPAGLAHSPPGTSLSDTTGPSPVSPPTQTLAVQVTQTGFTQTGFSQTLYNDLEASGLEFPSPWWLFTPSVTLSSATPFSLQALDGSSGPSAAPTFLSGVISSSLKRPGVGLYSL